MVKLGMLLISVHQRSVSFPVFGGDLGICEMYPLCLPR